MCFLWNRDIVLVRLTLVAKTLVRIIPRHIDFEFFQIKKCFRDRKKKCTRMLNEREVGWCHMWKFFIACTYVIMIPFLSWDSCVVFFTIYPFAMHDFLIDFQVSFIFQLLMAVLFITHSQVYDMCHQWSDTCVDYLHFTSNTSWCALVMGEFHLGWI